MSFVTLATATLIRVAWAQLPEQPPKDSETFTFRTDTRLVDLHATVMDKEGHVILNLPQSAFTIYENGVKQNIKVFRHEDAPVSLGLVIDNSASMPNKRAKVGSAALALVGASNPDDEVFIMNFNEETSLEKDYTNNIEALADAFRTINSRGGTAMRDALVVACHDSNTASILLGNGDGTFQPAASYPANVACLRDSGGFQLRW